MLKLKKNMIEKILIKSKNRGKKTKKIDYIYNKLNTSRYNL